MYGMNRLTGKSLAGRDHLVQSLQVLLSTPLGSRVMRPDFGSELVDLVDSPITPLTQLQINKSIFNAVSRWEPRFKLRQVQSVSRDVDGELTFTLIGSFEGQEISIEGLRPLVPATPVTVPSGETEVFAFLSGNDNLFISENDNIFVFDEVV